MSFNTLSCPGVDLSQPPRTLAGSQLEFELFLPGPRWAGCPRQGGLLPRRRTCRRWPRSKSGRARLCGTARRGVRAQMRCASYHQHLHNARQLHCNALQGRAAGGADVVRRILHWHLAVRAEPGLWQHPYPPQQVPAPQVRSFSCHTCAPAPTDTHTAAARRRQPSTTHPAWPPSAQGCLPPAFPDPVLPGVGVAV